MMHLNKVRVMNYTSDQLCKILEYLISFPQEMEWAGSKMKCNTLLCLLEKQTQKGIANERIQAINGGGKDGSCSASVSKAIDHADGRSFRAFQIHDIA